MPAMNAAKIQSGKIEITSVWDGTLEAKLESVLGIEPSTAKALIDADRQTSGCDPLILPVRAFLLRTADRVALVDTGSGTTKGPSMGHLPNSLEALGVSPSMIDTILLTHLHMDHIGGLVDPHGRPAFPHAELVMHAAEARYFLQSRTDDIDARSRRHIEFVRRAVAAYGDKVRQVENGGGIEGVEALLAAGHTPGHTCWVAGTGDQRVIVIGDLVHLSAVQLPRPDSALIYDVDPDHAAITRQDVLAHIAQSGMLVAGAHLPGSGLGKMTRSGEGYRFLGLD